MYTQTRDGLTEYKTYFYTYAPETYTDPQRIIEADKHLANEIAEAQTYIAQLIEHRSNLTKRYNELVTMSYRIQCELRRERSYKASKITYRIIRTRLFEDGTSSTIGQTTYSGTDRNKAIADFAELQKTNPSWVFLKDIERKSWER